MPRITDWPQEDRPREKLLLKGEQSLTDAELLAIFISTGTRGKTALDIAKALLIEYGTLKKLLCTPFAHLVQKNGVGKAKYASLKAALELGKRCLAESFTVGETLNNSRLTQQFLAGKLRGHQNEVFACLFMSHHFRLLAYEELFHGTVNESNVYPREIVRRGLAHNAAKIILAHNHPSGRAEPSAADKEVTKLIKQSLSIVDIEVVDHVIIGDTEHFSFAESGII